ncbi:MAG TPA: ABC transporter permease subunit [Edaphocola sp.]|nr:ABC transporter permease subunit [Edaphocola sp.]
MIRFLNKTLKSSLIFFIIALFYFLFLKYWVHKNAGGSVDLHLSRSVTGFWNIDNLNGHDVSLLSLTGSTLFYFFIVFVLSSLLGVVLGVLMGRFSKFGTATMHFGNFFRVMPSLVFIVLFKYQFRFTETYVYFVGVFACIWPILINTKSGVETTNPTQREAISLLRLPMRETLFSFLLPKAFPSIWEGMRIAMGISFLIVITCEYLNPGLLGLGALLRSYELDLSPLVTMCIILWIGLIGIIINMVFDFIEEKIPLLNNQFMIKN